MRRVFRYVGYLAAGIAFWIPSILVHCVRRDFGASRLDLLAVSILPLAASVITLESLYRRHRTSSRRGTIALWMLLGIWVFGPLCTTIGATFGGGGFTQPGGWHILLLGIPLFVPLTFTMSTYDGTLGALLVITLSFAIAGFVSLVRKGSPQQAPPGM